MNFLPFKWNKKSELPSELTIILTDRSKPTRIPSEYRQLEIIEGRAWLTTENSPYDHVLRVGQCFEIKSAKHAVIQPNETAVIRLTL